MSHHNPIQITALHGFTGSGADFDLLRLQRPTAVWTTPDLPGHGIADTDDPADYSVDAIASGLATRYPRTSGPEILVGYSMGGRVALNWAVSKPSRFSALILIGAHPGLEAPDDRTTRIAQDDARAEAISRDGATAFCRNWAKVPLIATQNRIQAPFYDDMQARRSRNDAHGLALSARWTGTGRMEPMWDRLDEIRIPTWVVAGADDPKYVEIGGRIARAISGAKLSVIDGAGHAAHLERPEVFLAGLDAFLELASGHELGDGV